MRLVSETRIDLTKPWIDAYGRFSRVPCVGEHIHTRSENGGGVFRHWRVERVLHTPDDENHAAVLFVKHIKPGGK